MTFNPAECSLRGTSLLEYLDLTLNARSWVSLHNSLALTRILLYYCKEFLWWLPQLLIDFQLTTLNGCSITGWVFFFANSIASFWHRLGFVSYFHGLFLDSFQTTKRHSYYDYSIYMPNFNSILEAVYPVGVTINRSCFTQRISHNSRNLYRIGTKVGTEIRFKVPVLCTKFQLDPNMRWHFIATFLSVRKDKE